MAAFRPLCPLSPADPARLSSPLGLPHHTRVAPFAYVVGVVATAPAPMSFGWAGGLYPRSPDEQTEEMA